MKARASVLNLNGYAQLTDYIKAQGEAKAVYGDVDAKIGAGDGYFGAHVKAEAGVIKVNGSVVGGSDNFNGYIKGDAQVLTANGKAAFEFEDDGVYSVGFIFHAVLTHIKNIKFLKSSVQRRFLAMEHVMPNLVPEDDLFNYRVQTVLKKNKAVLQDNFVCSTLLFKISVENIDAKFFGNSVWITSATFLN